MKKILTWVFIAVMCLSVFAGCGKDSGGKDEKTTPVESGETLEDAKSYLYEMYKNDAIPTPADYTRVSAIKIGDTKFTVTWKAAVSTGDETDVKITAGELETTIDVNEQTAKEVAYTLTAVIADKDGKTVEQSFEHTIPAFVELTWDQYVAAAKGDTLVVKGIVTAILSKAKGNSSNSIYFQDNDGGYYAYSLSDDEFAKNEIKEGMTIRVTGKRDTYSGTYEITGPTVEILDAATAVPAPVDYTEIYKNAKTVKDAELVSKQALLVTIKGVEIEASSDSDKSSGYYRFKMGDLRSYIRISGSSCPLVKDDQTKFIEEHGKHTGWIANATGLITIYDGAFYLTPITVNAFEYVKEAEKTDAQKLAEEKEALSVPGMIIVSGDTKLPAEGNGTKDVKITWTSDNAAAVVGDGKLTVTMPAAETTVKLTAKLTLGTLTETKEFSVKLAVPKAALDVAGAVAAMKDFTGGQVSDDIYTVTGEVTSSSYNEKYGSYTVWLKDGATEKAFELYSVAFAAGLDSDAYHAADGLKGKTVTCMGFLQKYVNSGTGETVFEMPYLAAGKNPTGANFTPPMTAIK